MEAEYPGSGRQLQRVLWAIGEARRRRLSPPGSALAGAISLGLDAGSIVPHGGILDLFVPNAIDNVAGWFLAIVAGTITTTAVLFVTKRLGTPARTRPEPALAA